MGEHTLNLIADMSLRVGYRYEQDMTAVMRRLMMPGKRRARSREAFPGVHGALNGPSGTSIAPPAQ